MAVQNDLSSTISNVPNFYNLALLICNLFTNGHFRLVNILYDPNILDSQLISDIQLFCPYTIQWLMTDITESPSSLWQRGQNIDHIFQLFVIDLNHLPKNIGDLDAQLPTYRLFVFYSTDIAKLTEQMDTFKRSNPIGKDDSLILFYDSSNESMWLKFWTNNTDLGDLDVKLKDQKCINHQEKCSFESKDLFRMTFGKFDQNWLTMITYTNIHTNSENEAEYKMHENWNGCPFFANYFMMTLNASYINMTVYHHNDGGVQIIHNIVHSKPQKLYKELTADFNAIEKDTLAKLRQNRPNVLTLALHSQNPIERAARSVEAISLYPFRSTALSVIFIYGKDYQRQINNNLVSKLKLFLFNWTNLFVVGSAIVLWQLRRLSHCDSFIAVLIDVIVIFIGGGIICTRHLFEKWFFVIVSIGAFFLNAICLDSTLFPSYLHLQQSIDTFQQLAQINSPIYFSPVLKTDEDLIEQMLRKKIRPDIQYMGSNAYLLEVLQIHEAFILVTEKNLVDRVIVYIRNSQRDFDVLPETLGFLQSSYYLISDQYIPERIKNKIDSVTCSMMENGLYRFYDTFTDFLTKLRMESIQNEENYELTMEDFQSPLTACTYFIAFAWLVFIFEIVIFRFRSS